jgi:hypothetical protein
MVTLATFDVSQVLGRNGAIASPRPFRNDGALPRDRTVVTALARLAHAGCEPGVASTARPSPKRVDRRVRRAYALRPLKWFHRRVMLHHGLLIARTPLSPMERRLVSLLLTEQSRARRRSRGAGSPVGSSG